MADRKISDLVALTTPAAGDYLPIVDISEASAANKNKRITIEELLRGAPDGTAAAPSIAFESDGDNGLYLAGTDTIGVSTNGTNRLTLSTTAFTSTLPIVSPLGAAATPSFTFTGDTNTGIYSPGADQVAITTGGTARLTSTTTALTSTLPIDVPLGAQGTPSLTFTGDTNTGIYSPGADQVAISTNGTQRLTTDTAAVTSTLPVVHPLGAVGTPSITFTGDLNTGLWSPAADTLAASTGGSERARIDPSGRVGIGTTSPDASTKMTVESDGTVPFGIKINVADNNKIALLVPKGYIAGDSAGATGRFAIGNCGDSNSEMTVASRGFISFYTGASDNATGTERARIDSGGRLLVGTSSSTMSGGVVQQNGNLGIIANNTTNLANNGTLSITTNNSGGSFTGFLIAENTLVSNAAIRTQTLFAVMGRGTSATFTSLATQDGGSGAASFTLTVPSNGVILLTNTQGNPTNVNLCWYGPAGY